MYSNNKYRYLKTKYGHYSSWAIWDYKNSHDTTIIDQNIYQLHSGFVLLGLNVSRTLDKPPWSNFHDNTHARKLKYACNNTKLRGSYMTDLFKDVVAKRTSEFRRKLNDESIGKNIKIFKQEMKDIEVNNNTQFVFIG